MRKKQARQKVATAAKREIRDTIRCGACTLVQYRTRDGKCRRCRAWLLMVPKFVIPLLPEGIQQKRTLLSGPLISATNAELVNHIGDRVRDLRRAQGMTQEDLMAKTRVKEGTSRMPRGHVGVSRSYLARIEGGVMTPGLDVLERLADGLGVGIERLFIQEDGLEALIEDPFVRAVLPFLKRLSQQQWEQVLERLAAI